ncbi:hypothetical protein EYF80_050716 [Liparis tanakae]|uniref:Uncharacterized protein n=1 Tax=Liparis tanakae TaxID=230148 RepID=A0A4Z2FDR4_9TELE|nr:hypothetical protein EYF80_050716 [Liparis tanakae]
MPHHQGAHREFSSSRIAPRFLARPVVGTRNSSSSSSSSSGFLSGERPALSPSSIGRSSSSSSNRSSKSFVGFFSRWKLAKRKREEGNTGRERCVRTDPYRGRGGGGGGGGAQALQQPQAALRVGVGQLAAPRAPGQAAHREALLVLLPAAGTTASAGRSLNASPDGRPRPADLYLSTHSWLLTSQTLRAPPTAPPARKRPHGDQTTTALEELTCFDLMMAPDEKLIALLRPVSLHVVSGKGLLVFLLRSDSPAALHVISGSSRVATDAAEGRPDSWTPHRHAAASGRHFPASLLEESKRRTPDAIFQTRKLLTKRYRAATAVITARCCKALGMRSAMNVRKTSEERSARRRREESERRRRPRDIKVHVKDAGKAVVRQRDDTSNASSQLEIRRSSAWTVERNEHLNLNLLLMRTQEQHPAKAAASESDDDDDDDDGFYVEGRLSLASREKTGSIHRPRAEIKPTQNDNEVDFNEQIIAQRAEWRRREGEGEPERRQTNTHANQRRLAYLLGAHFTHKTGNNDDVETKQVLTESGGEVLIVLFLPDADGKSWSRCLKADARWGTVTTAIEWQFDLPPMRKVMKESFIFESEGLKESLFSLEMYAADRSERIDVEAAERRAEVTTASSSTEDGVEGTVETETNNSVPGENMGINHTEEEGDVTSDESVVFSPPSLKMTERETAKTAETAPVDKEIKEETSSTEVWAQGGEEYSPPSTETPEQARFITRTTGSGDVPVGKSFWGLRMREDVPEETSVPLEETGARALADGKAVQRDPGVNSVTGTLPKVSRVAQPQTHRVT